MAPLTVEVGRVSFPLQAAPLLDPRPLALGPARVQVPVPVRAQALAFVLVRVSARVVVQVCLVSLDDPAEEALQLDESRWVDPFYPDLGWVSRGPVALGWACSEGQG